MEIKGKSNAAACKEVLISELEEIIKLTDLNVDDLTEISELEFKVCYAIKLFNAVRLIVIENHLKIESWLDACISKYFFPPSTMGIHNSNQKYSTFIDNILMKMNFSQKVSFIEKISDIPKKNINQIRKINDLRNYLAHSFSTEHEDRYKRLRYEGKLIGQIDTLKKFLIDSEKIWRLLKNLRDELKKSKL